jgi:hypothetical protein
MVAALVALTIIHVFTLGQCSEHSIGLALSAECNNPIHLAICGITLLANEKCFATKDKL